MQDSDNWTENFRVELDRSSVSGELIAASPGFSGGLCWRCHGVEIESLRASLAFRARCSLPLIRPCYDKATNTASRERREILTDPAMYGQINPDTEEMRPADSI